MHNKNLRHLAGESPDNRGQTSYLVHAAVLKVSGGSSAPDEDFLSKLVRRRLSRLERVLASHGGTLIEQMPQGLLAAFESAEQAVLVACEMQRRCAVIPQIMETQIGLKIGIHPAPSERHQDLAKTAAARLATLLGDSTIVAATAVIEALPDTLRDKTSVLVGEHIGVAAHVIDWDAVPMRPAPVTAPSNPVSRPTPALILRQGSRTYRFDQDKTIITIGRDPENDLVIRTPNASRQHCRIVFRHDDHVLVDLSTNGTFVKLGSGPETAIRKNMVTLCGSGLISFGHSCEQAGEHVFEFEIG